MSSTTKPQDSALPQTAYAAPRTLAKATLWAFAAAAAITIAFVVPAETGIDPTGIGKLTGLVNMSGADPEIPEETSTPAPALPAAAPDQAAIEAGRPWQQAEMTIELPPHSGTELKAHMVKGDSFVFEWVSQGGPVRVDMHGEPPNAGDDDFTSYWKQRETTSQSGNFTAPFEGTHGWYWRNKGEAPVTVTIRVAGFYEDLFRP